MNCVFLKDSKQYQVFINNFNSLDNINIGENILGNDAFQKFTCDINCKGEIIITNNLDKITNYKNEIYKETYDEYLNFINNYDNSKDMWIYNIINGIKEQHNIIYQNDSFMILKSYDWNTRDINKMHLLTIPKDISLRSIRSLTNNHVNLLKFMKNITINIIKEKYNIYENKLKIFFHYPPSTYHLHIHFTIIDDKDINSSVEYSHNLDDVIFNLEICDDYYKKIVINKKI